jgi:hypothetical protein
MTRYWVRWQDANDEAGPRTGPFSDRQAAAHYVQDTVRGFAADMEHGTGAAGEWTPDGRLFRGDLDIELGRFVIEEEPDDASRPE